MAWETTYTAHAEVVLDHSRVCDHCGRSFLARVRAFGEGGGKAVTGLFGVSPDKAVAVATQAARENAEGLATTLRGRVVPHRCTHCGKFGSADIAAMRESYSGYRSAQWSSIGCFLLLTPVVAALGSFLVFGLVALVLLFVQRHGHQAGDDVPLWVKVYWGSIPVLTIGACVLAWRAWRPIPEPQYQAEIDAANQTDIAAAWLQKWNAQSEHVARLGSPDLKDRLGAWMNVCALLRSQGPAHVPESLWPSVAVGPPPSPPAAEVSAILHPTPLDSDAKTVACTCCGQQKGEIDAQCPHCKYMAWGNVLPVMFWAAAFAAAFAALAIWWFETRFWVVVCWVLSGFLMLLSLICLAWVFGNVKALLLQRRRSGAGSSKVGPKA